MSTPVSIMQPIIVFNPQPGAASRRQTRAHTAGFTSFYVHAVKTFRAMRCRPRCDTTRRQTMAMASVPSTRRDLRRWPGHRLFDELMSVIGQPFDAFERFLLCGPTSLASTRQFYGSGGREGGEDCMIVRHADLEFQDRYRVASKTFCG